MAARDRLSNFTVIPFIYGKKEFIPRLIDWSQKYYATFKLYKDSILYKNGSFQSIWSISYGPSLMQEAFEMYFLS